MPDVKPLEELTVKELKTELTEMGFGAIADTLQTRTQLLEVISGLKAKPANASDVEIPPVDPDKAESASEERRNTRAWRNKAKAMKAHLDAQPQVQVFLPLEGKESIGNLEERIVNGKIELRLTGAYETVTLNGYRVYIPKGRSWKVPEQVAEIIGQSMTDTAMAGKEFEIDRPNDDNRLPFATVSEALQ